MCELFAISSKTPTKVTFSLEEFKQHGGLTGHHCDGWGLAFYDGSDANIFREKKPAAYSAWMEFLLHHQHRSQCVISHIRHATQGVRSLRNTQPFTQELHGQRHVFAHNGNLKCIRDIIPPSHHSPMGDTDSEYAFCYLMDQVEKIWQADRPSLAERRAVVSDVFTRLSPLGPANFLYSDGDYLYAFANKRTQVNGSVEPPGLYYLCRHCADDPDSLPISDSHVESDMQEIVLFASVPLSDEAWIPFKCNQLVVAQLGKLYC